MSTWLFVVLGLLGLAACASGSPHSFDIGPLEDHQLECLVGTDCAPNGLSGTDCAWDQNGPCKTTGQDTCGYDQTVSCHEGTGPDAGFCLMVPNRTNNRCHGEMVGQNCSCSSGVGLCGQKYRDQMGESGCGPLFGCATWESCGAANVNCTQSPAP